MPNRPPPPLSHLLATTDPSTIITTFALGGILLYLLFNHILVPIYSSVATIIISIMGPEMREKLELLFGNIDAGARPKGGIVFRVWRIFKRSGLGLGNIGGHGIEAAEEYCLVGDDGEGQVGVCGLWNQGNTCYQNSVLQAMASCKCLRSHLTAVARPEVGEELGQSEPRPMIVTLVGLLDALNRSWGALYVPPTIAGSPGVGGGVGDWLYNEQQDAQEFYQRLTAGVEKEVGKYCERLKKSRIGLGLGQLILGMDTPGENNGNDVDKMAATVESVRGWVIPEVLKNPFEGWVVHRVGCLRCGYVEAIRMQAFTSLSLSLVSEYECTLEDCLADYTHIERIEQVDCDKCTLLHHQTRLQTLHHVQSSSSLLPPAYEATVNERLEIITQALAEDDFSQAVFDKLAIPRGQRTSVTKTKQTMLVRTPMVLALHLNRSQFDMQSGMIRKNYAPVKVPMWLDVGAVGVVVGEGGWEVDPGKPISVPEPRKEDDVIEGGDARANKALYELKGLVAHYGGHHNGHYICYRKTGKRWWKISDENVVGVFGGEVEAVRNAFMCFYERVESVAVMEEYERRRKIEREMKRIATKANHEEGKDELAVGFPTEGLHPDTKQLIEEGDVKGSGGPQSLTTGVGVSGPGLGPGGRNFGSDRDIDAVLSGAIFGSVLEASAGMVETGGATNCGEGPGQEMVENTVVEEEKHKQDVGGFSGCKPEMDMLGLGKLPPLNVASPPNPAPVPPMEYDPVVPLLLAPPPTTSMDTELLNARANSESQEKSEVVGMVKLASSPPEPGLITSTDIHAESATPCNEVITLTSQAAEGHVHVEDMASGTAAAKTNGDDTKCTASAPNHKIPRTGKNKKGKKKSRGANTAVKDSKPLGQEGGEPVMVN